MVSALNKRHFILAPLVLLFIGLLYVMLGLYYEDNQNIVASIDYGELGTSPSDQWINDFDFLLTPFFGWLCKTLPQVPVYGYWLLAQLFLWLFGLINFAWVFFRRQQQLPLTSVLLFLLLVFFLTLDSITSQHCVRNSILLSYTGLLYLYYSSRPTHGRYLFSLLLFIVALVVRIHSAVIVLLFFLALQFLANQRKFSSFKKYTLHAAIGFLAIGIYHVNGALTTNQGKIIETRYEWALFDKSSLYPLGGMHTHRDSVKYMALKAILISDSAEMTPEFLKRTVDLRYEYSGLFNPENIHNFFHEIKRSLSEHWEAFALISLLFLLWAVHRLRDWPTGKTVLSLLFLYTGILTALLINLVSDLKDRLFAPLTAMVVLHLALLFIPVIVSEYRRRIQLTLLLLFTLACAFLFKDQLNVTTAWAATEQTALKNQALLRQYSSNHRLFGTVNTDLPMTRDIFYRATQNPFYKLGYIDAGYMVYYSYMYQKYVALFGYSPLNYRAFLQAIPHNPDYRMYASEERMKLFQQYFAGVYTTTVVATLDSSTPNWSLNARGWKLAIADTIPTP